MDYEIEYVPVSVVAKALKTTHRKVVLMILNRTLPIGCVAEPDTEGGHYTVRIFRHLWEMYQRGELR